ncbi:hypothetical protein DM02DRAFT_667541 [Periconia macrospinosa]|uniref:Uncharacterized protein n=1 Tax=Periconia macrospinosa TaxID=97972 RepID=A0A2V1E6Z7_9PLEO|nr:hypothetical protein DM02DRAFT_667541 [Periconia macrospinosa]
MESNSATLEKHSIYVFLNLRGAEPGFHWGIFVPTNQTQGGVWHAVNRGGGWMLEIIAATGIPNDMSLCLCFKIGKVASQKWNTLEEILRKVPANGLPSSNTQEIFTCRVWVKDALFALDVGGVIRLAKSVEDIEKAAIEKAESNRDAIEREMTSEASKSHITGTAAAAKDAGYRHFKHFLESYGLRIWNDDDVQEGKAILRGMGYGV